MPCTGALSDLFDLYAVGFKYLSFYLYLLVRYVLCLLSSTVNDCRIGEQRIGFHEDISQECLLVFNTQITFQMTLNKLQVTNLYAGGKLGCQP